MAKGKVYLVGGGPGDPGLITLRGVECLQQADLVLYDRLINPALLRHARPGAEVVYVGKAAGGHALSQQGINDLLVARAQAGDTVVRLKGGDPFVFGRGGEEALALVEAGVPFEVVPGISSSIAAPAYAGIPVTHRNLASSFAVITGHEDPTKPDSSLHWEHLAKGVDTLVFLMGLENLPLIVEQLVANGRPPETPIALVRWGTWARQETLTGTLSDIQDKLQGRAFSPPVATIVGPTVPLREQLAWFDNRPLSGVRVLVTRAREQASQLAAQLAALGAEPVEAPAIEIAEPDDYAPLDEALRGMNRYRWVVFTSANGVLGSLPPLAGDGEGQPGAGPHPHRRRRAGHCRRPAGTLRGAGPHPGRLSHRGRGGGADSPGGEGHAHPAPARGHRYRASGPAAH